MSINDINSLSHTKWNCKYHIVFAPKYRRKVFYREKRVEIGKILRQLCEWRGVKIIGLMSIKGKAHDYENGDVWDCKSLQCKKASSALAVLSSENDGNLTPPSSDT